MTRRLLITGGNSFIGTAFVRRLSTLKDFDVVATYRQNVDQLLDPPPSHIAYQACDLANSDDVSSLFAQHKFDAVVHLAAALPGKSEIGFAPIAQRDNIDATEHLLKAAKDTGCQRFVFVSTIGVYDGLKTGFVEDVALSPTSIYGQSKFAGEKLLEVHCGSSLEGVSLRMPGVHGAGKNKGSVYAFLKAALAGEQLSVSEPKSLFRILFIDDAINALLTSLKADLPQSYCCYNVAGQEVLSLVDLAKGVLAVTKSASRLNVCDNPIGRKQILNIAKIDRELSFKPELLETHLATLCTHLKG